MHAKQTQQRRRIHFDKIMVTLLMAALVVTFSQTRALSLIPGVLTAWIPSAMAQSAAAPAQTAMTPSVTPTSPPTPENPAAPPTHPTAPPRNAVPPAATTHIPDCLQPRPTDALPDGNQKLTVTKDRETRWQPGNGMVRFTVAGTDLTAGDIRIVGCFRWNNGETKQGWHSVVPLQVIKIEPGR